MKSPVIPVRGQDDDAIRARMREENLRLLPAELRRVEQLLGREPTRVEAVLFDTLWSEHCSYKSSRAVLKEFLPTEAPHVILGPGEDAGVVYLTTHRGERWALVVGHESHNHPSQVVPFEGAATGIGGIVRDIYCMGADVIGVLDALRFGDPGGPGGERAREIAAGVVDGIWHYGNALGVPNIGGDVVFDRAYDDNCLVNVVALGVVPESGIVRSRVPQEARTEPYVFVLVGKPTDASGFGGASFASADLDEDEAEANKGAVQIPDPFLKRVLSEANRVVLELARAGNVAVGFKDLGAGGIACATSELAAAGGMGAEVELTSVSLDNGPFPPEVISCSETQERFCWVVPRAFAQRVLEIYNDEFELPRLYPGARAQVIGRVRAEDTLYRVTHEGDVVCEATTEAITEGILYDREAAPAPPPSAPVDSPALPDLGGTMRALLTGTTLGSRSGIYRHYDGEVRGRAWLRPGEADAGVLIPVDGAPVGLAVSVDGNPFHGALDPYAGGAGAVIESMRNVVAVGAEPWCLTDCLNYGNPERPEVFRQFREGVRGIGEAARGVGMLRDETVPVPVVSGNVSFYNQSAGGSAIPPSPIVACFGVLADYAYSVTPALEEAGNVIVLVGERRRELGGSAYWRHLGVTGGDPPRADFGVARSEMLAVHEAIERGQVQAAHDIGEGGLIAAAAEMALAGELGVRLDADRARTALRIDEWLFSETGGFLLELEPGHEEPVLALCRRHGAAALPIGEVVRQRELTVVSGRREELRVDLEALAPAWDRGVREAMR